MSETMSVNMLTQMLDRLAGVTFCSRMDPATGKSKWLYISKKAPELYDVPEEELVADPDSALARLVPKDRDRIAATIGELIQSGGGSVVMQSRIVRRNGEIRWTETHATIEPDADGSLLWYGQSLDVTERKQTEESLLASEAARAKADALYRQVLDALPTGVTVAGKGGELLLMNPAQRRILGGATDDVGGGEALRAYGLFMEDGVTPITMENSGISYALRGETMDHEVVVKNARVSGAVRMSVSWTPLRDENGVVFAAVGASQDITLQRALEAELRARNEELAASEQAKTHLIERLRHAIDELSNPILEVWEGVLAMPIIGLVDSRRTADMVQRLLGEVARMQASFVIIDLTGVDVVDTKTADHLMKLMRKVEVVGARCVLTGIRPAVAETLVDIGVDFGRLNTLRNLEHGLREALRLARRERKGLRDQDLEDEPTEERRRNR